MCAETENVAIPEAVADAVAAKAFDGLLMGDLETCREALQEEIRANKARNLVCQEQLEAIRLEIRKRNLNPDCQRCKGAGSYRVPSDPHGYEDEECRCEDVHPGTYECADCIRWEQCAAEFRAMGTQRECSFRPSQFVAAE